MKVNQDVKAEMNLRIDLLGFSFNDLKDLEMVHEHAIQVLRLIQTIRIENGEISNVVCLNTERRKQRVG